MTGGAGPIRAVLTTRGRRTGRKHSVMLRAVVHDEKVYFSRHRPDSDWFRNAVAEPKVSVGYGGRVFSGRARVVTDAGLEREISLLKYPGERRAGDRRAVMEVTLDGDGARRARLAPLRARPPEEPPQVVGGTPAEDHGNGK